MNLRSIECKKWREGEGERLAKGEASGVYLKNRLELAWQAGWDTARHNDQIILGALDTLAMALTEHGHTWTEGEKEIYEQAVAAITGQIKTT